MEKIYLTVEESAQKSGLSSVQIWILIRNKIITSKIIRERIFVDFIQINVWMLKNARSAYELGLPVDSRNFRFSLRQVIKRCLKKR